MGLEGIAPARVDKALERCLQECEWMPHIVDVRKRLPEPDGYFRMEPGTLQSEEAKQFFAKVREIGAKK